MSRQMHDAAHRFALHLLAIAAAGLSVPAQAMADGKTLEDTHKDDAAPPALSNVAVSDTAPEQPTMTEQAAPPPAPPSPISIKGTLSQFAGSVVSGDAQDTIRYGGKADLYADVKGSAIGLDDSINLHIHPEFRYGEATNGDVGLLPANTALFYPASDGDKFDLAINVTKTWKNGASLTVGKMDVLDMAAHLPIVGGGGHEGFQNLAFALPPSAIVPGTITGAQIYVPTKQALYRFWVFDPQLQTRKSGFESPFDKGVAFLASVTKPVKIAGKPGYYAVKLAGSTRSELATEALPAALVPAPGSGFGEGASKGEFSIVIAGYQVLDSYDGMRGKGWGVFGQVYASAGDPTFLDKSAIFGISGNPKFRPDDRFGLAWFRYSLTDRLVNVLANRLPLEDEEGVEAFYTLGISKNMRLTADVQVVDSAIAFRDRGVTTTLRLTTKF